MKMKAVYFNEIGPPSVLQVGTLPDLLPSQLGADEILIDIHVSSVNGADWKVRIGKIPIAQTPKFPHILGRDFSGVVRHIGSAVKDFQVGDEVFGVCDVGQEGTYCEQIIMKASLCCQKPANIGHAEICSVALPGLTAIVALQDECLNIQSGERCFIQGGAGGVGSFAIQMAKHELGAHVITTTSTKNLEYVQSFGPDQVINYETDDFVQVLSKSDDTKCDAVLDCVGGDVALRSFDVIRAHIVAGDIKQKGRAAFIASGKAAPPSPYPDTVESLRPNVQRGRHYLEQIVKLMEKGTVEAPAMQFFTLEEAVRVHEISQSRHFRGKLMFQIKSN